MVQWRDYNTPSRRNGKDMAKRRMMDGSGANGGTGKSEFPGLGD